LFGAAVRHTGLLVRVSEPRTILGRLTSGRRTAKGWMPEV